MITFALNCLARQGFIMDFARLDQARARQFQDQSTLLSYTLIVVN